MSLSGKTILLTRQPEQAGDLIRDIEDRGGRALLFPTIQIVPPESWLACDRALDTLDRYDGYVFTSANAVTRFLGRAADRGIDLGPIRARPVWALGEKTAATLAAQALVTEALPEAFTGTALARRIGQRGMAPGRLLVPQGELASGELSRQLRASGWTVDTVIVYRTVSPSVHEAEEIRTQLTRGHVDVVTFFSPSAARNFAVLVGEGSLVSVLSRVVVAVIGPTTGNAVRALGVEPAVVPERSTARGLLEAIEQHFAGYP